MFEEILNMIQQGAQSSVVDNHEVPNEHNEAIINEAHNAVTNGLQSLAQSGNLQALAQGGTDVQALSGNPAVQNISTGFMDSITQKFGISKSTAAMIASAVIPMVLSKIMGKAQNSGVQSSGGGFDLGSILGSLTGGGNQPASGGGLMDTLSKVGAGLGLDKDGDGDVDLSDLTKMMG
ncbi:MAG: hypothetical protein QM642_12245 [Edaphocola sp.]